MEQETTNSIIAGIELMEQVPEATPRDEATREVENIDVSENALFPTPSELNALMDVVKTEIKTITIESIKPIVQYEQIIEDDATAAGLTVTDSPSSHTFVQVGRIGEFVSPLSYEYSYDTTQTKFIENSPVEFVKETLSVAIPDIPVTDHWKPPTPIEVVDPIDVIDPIETITDPVTDVQPDPEPEVPTEPIVPVEPITPIEPVEPEVPIEPEIPTDPITPIDPVIPVDPITPIEPEVPVIPIEPEPEIPVEPIDPIIPIDPIDPELPVEPETPIDPVIPIEEPPIDPPRVYDDKPNSGAGNGGEGGETENSETDQDPGNSSEHNNSPDVPPGQVDPLPSPIDLDEHQNNCVGNGDQTSPGNSSCNSH